MLKTHCLQIMTVFVSDKERENRKQLCMTTVLYYVSVSENKEVDVRSINSPFFLDLAPLPSAVGYRYFETTYCFRFQLICRYFDH